MKKLVALVVVAAVVVGIVKVARDRTSHADARAACARMVEMCGPNADNELMKSTNCADELASNGPQKLGPVYQPMLDCVTAADSCAELIGCATKVGRDFVNDLNRSLAH